MKKTIPFVKILQGSLVHVRNKNVDLISAQNWQKWIIENQTAILCWNNLPPEARPSSTTCLRNEARRSLYSLSSNLIDTTNAIVYFPCIYYILFHRCKVINQLPREACSSLGTTCCPGLHNSSGSCLRVPSTYITDAGKSGSGCQRSKLALMGQAGPQVSRRWMDVQVSQLAPRTSPPNQRSHHIPIPFQLYQA